MSRVARGLLVVYLVGLVAAPVLVRGQIAMPNPKEISGVPLTTGQVPAGTISARVIRGGFDKPVEGASVKLTFPKGGGRTSSITTDALGRAPFPNVAMGALAKVETTVDGETITSQEMTLGAGGGVSVLLVLTDPDATKREAEDKQLAAGPAVKGTVVLGPNTRIVVEPGDEAVTVFYVLDIVNSARQPVDLGGPLQLDLPDGARGAGTMDGSSPQGKLQGAHLIVIGPFKPGSTEVQLAFELPAGSSTTTISQTFPVSVPDASVVLQRSQNEDLQSAQLVDRREGTNQGQRLVFARVPALGPGETLTFAVTGLLHHPRWPRYIALTLAIGFLIVGLREGFRRA